MNAADFLRSTVELLDRAGIEYMVTGSFASSFYGEARSTVDLDVVVELDVTDVERLIESIDREIWYVSENELRQAGERRTMANLIDYSSGWKVDLLVRKARPFSELEFRRRRTVVLLGQPVVMASPEDVILSKLEWARDSASDRQLRDARSIAKVQRDALDTDYLAEQAVALGLSAMLDGVLAGIDGP